MAGNQADMTFNKGLSKYDDNRFNYPDEIWDSILAAIDLNAHTNVLEIGSGVGKATKTLVKLGCRNLTVVEPAVNANKTLREALAHADTLKLKILPHSWEEAVPPHESFDLALAASSFHWVLPDTRDWKERVPYIEKIRESLKKGGVLSMWWYVYEDTNLNDPLINTLMSLWEKHGIERPMRSPMKPKYGEPDAVAEAIKQAGFDKVEIKYLDMPKVMTAKEMRALNATYSYVIKSDNAKSYLDELEDTLENKFGGIITLPSYLIFYLAVK